MRPIDHKQVRRLGNLAVIRATNTAIAAVLEGQRSAFIDAHDNECSALRTALWQAGCLKCWYSEALLQEGQGHVEHYRPKKRLWGAGHPGYWWRAFDWENLRLAHPTVNLRKTDYLTGKRVGKGAYFPLMDEEVRANNLAEEENEDPVLLDPIVAFDAQLICFSESGAPFPRYKAEENDWFHRRARDSIDYYHLDEGTWNARCEDLMSEVGKLCENLVEIDEAVPRDEEAYSALIDQIVEYINPYAEFSSACLQVVCELGLLEHFNPAPPPQNA